jgi:hypothetical protein
VILQDDVDDDDDVPEELEEVVEQLLCGLRDRYVCSTVGTYTRYLLLCLAERGRTRHASLRMVYA